mgnify:FL=1
MAYYAPTNFQGRPLTNSIAHLTWENNSIYSQIELKCITTSQTELLDGMETEYDWEGLTPGETYQFALRAQFYAPGGGEGQWSGYTYCEVEMVWEELAPPDNFSLVRFHTYAELSWFSTRLEDVEIEIFRSNSSHEYPSEPLATLPPNVEFYRDSNPPAHCWYKIRYKLHGGYYSDWSDEVEYTAPLAPAAVDDFHAEEIGFNSVVLAWTEPTTGGPIGQYEIQMRVGTYWVPKATLPYSWNHLLYEGLEPDTQYDFRIYSIGSGGSSPVPAMLSVRTLTLTESIIREKRIDEQREFRLTIQKDEETSIVVFSGESRGIEGYPFQLIETEDITQKLGGEMFSDTIQTGGGQVVVAAIIGEDEKALETTFLDFDLIGKRITLDILFGDEIYNVGNGFISSIELKEHKIYISYDDALSARIGTITPLKVGDEVVPEIWGWADVKITEVDSYKKKWRAAMHRIRSIDAVWKNEELIDPSNYYVNFATGEIYFDLSISFEEKDILVARVSGHVDSMDYIRRNPADVLSEYFGEYFDKKISSQNFRTEGGLTIYPIDLAIDDDLPASEMVGRVCRQFGLLSFQGRDGLAIIKADLARATDIYIQPDVEVIKAAERKVSQDNLCSKLIVHYGQTVSIPDENRYEKTYRDVGKEKEYDIWGSLNTAYELANDIFPAWDGKEKWTFSLPYILWNLWPGKVVEFETGEKIIVENLEFQFSKNQTIIGGIKL